MSLHIHLVDHPVLVVSRSVKSKTSVLPVSLSIRFDTVSTEYTDGTYILIHSCQCHVGLGLLS